MVELAILLPFVLMFPVYLINYALWIQSAVRFQDAAIAAAAYGNLRGNMADTNGMKEVANFAATGSSTVTSAFTPSATDFYTCSSGGAHVAISALCAGNLPPMHYIQVTTAGTVNRAMNFPGLPSSLALGATVIYRVEVTP